MLLNCPFSIWSQIFHFASCTEQGDSELMFLAYIWEVPGSSLGRNFDYTD
jgi:hypothetical protein